MIQVRGTRLNQCHRRSERYPGDEKKPGLGSRLNVKSKGKGNVSGLHMDNWQ